MAASRRSSATSVLTCAAIGGVAIGAASLTLEEQGRADLTTSVRTVAVTTGLARARPPQAGDHWGGCNDARAAGTAPIYRDEPGYRDDMDGDGDGIACEPVP